MNNIKHILISRIDNIGDVILTLPLTGILKHYFPDVKITFLGREYARAIVEHCEHVDDFLDWDKLSQMKESDAITQIKSHAFDAVIHVLPNKQIALLMKKANVRYRIASVSRAYHWFPSSSRLYLWSLCNKSVWFHRKKSGLHEAQRHLNLLRPFNITPSNNLTYLREMMGFSCNEPLSSHLQSQLIPTQFNLIVHPFTNGHAREWPVSHFIALINQLPREQFNIIVTGSQKEKSVIEQQIMPHCPHVTNFAGQCDLREFTQLIAHADGLVANSTGPLHIAAALGIHTLGLFPFKKIMNADRWGPLGEKAEVVIADPSCNAPMCRDKNDCLCMESITVAQVKNKIINWL